MIRQSWSITGLGVLAVCLALAAANSCFAGPEVSSALPSSQARGKTAQPQSEFDIPLEINGEAAANLTLVPFYINISVPHHSNSTVTSCTAYPYPIQPLRRNNPMHLLDTNYYTLKKLIEQTAYTRKSLKVQAYPVGGWRWQYAYAVALRRCGQDEPHYLLSFIPFVNAMLPYCHEEVKKLNDTEVKREIRYRQAVADSQAMRADAETEATRRGVEPQAVRFKKFFATGDRQATIKVAAGQWWVVATHKVPGLTYYWQQPMTVHEDQNNVVTLNEDNALTIEGAW